jgi:monoamine oxidase
VNRRNFIKSTIATAAYAGLASKTSLASVGPVRQSNSRRVLVLGAGLAGLAAAMELDHAGYQVTVLEARTRPGGRVYTMREPFSDGLYAEAGASRIQDTHEFTLKYVKQFNLPLLPFFPDKGNNIVYVGGKRLVVPVGKQANMADLPLTFTDEERKAGVIGSLVKYVFSKAGEIGDPTQPNWPPASAAKFEVPFMEFVREQGASEGLLHMTALGQDLSRMSTLQFLRDVVLAAKTKAFYKIRGGNDQLPKAIAEKLADKIYYGAPVIRIEQDEKSARAIYLQAGTPQTLTADYIVCAIPSPVMRRIEVSPALSPQKRQAIQELEYMAMARVHLQARKRFWLERGENGFANTDDPIEIWDYTRDQPGSRGILGAYTSGRMALKLTYREPAERTQYMLEMTERVFPGMHENYETSASHSWVSDPWCLGAAAEFASGQLSAFYRYLPLPEGRIHFAGEHTSPWNGWMNGGLESGERAAKEIQARG